MIAPVGITTRTKRSRLHWLLRSMVLGVASGAVSLPFWSGIAAPLWRFEVTYWTSTAPLSPKQWHLQSMAWRWAMAQPISFQAWLGTLATGAAISIVAYWWESWASRPMDSSQQIRKE